MSEESKELELVEKRLDVLERTLFGNGHKGLKAELVELKTQIETFKRMPYGGKIRGGRMVALKSAPVWTNLSRFGRPYPPFDYGSGMGMEDIGREEAVELGLCPTTNPRTKSPTSTLRLKRKSPSTAYRMTWWTLL